MKTISIRELRNTPKVAREALEKAGEAVLTANGQPVAVLLPVTADIIESTLRQLRLGRAIDALRRQSRMSGNDRITAAEIEVEIAAVRHGRRKPVPHAR